LAAGDVAERPAGHQVTGNEGVGMLHRSHCEVVRGPRADAGQREQGAPGIFDAELGKGESGGPFLGDGE